MFCFGILFTLAFLPMITMSKWVSKWENLRVAGDVTTVTDEEMSSTVLE